MATVTCGGLDVLRGRLAIPLDGVWTAELYLDGAAMKTGAATVGAEGGLSLAGTAVRAVAELDTVHAHVLGGAGRLAEEVKGSFRQAQLRDPLQAITSAVGETLAASVDAAVLALELERWTLGRHHAGRALDELVAYAARTLGQAIHWRHLSDGKLWIGAETWPTVKLSDDAFVLERHPAERRIVIGCQAPALLPGVTLADEGRVSAVEHWIEPERVRTWAWTD